MPEFRKYERTSTTTINAYVAPVMDRYLGRLGCKLGSRRLAVMQSNGGIMSAESAGKAAARIVLSGSAAGVVGARYTAELAGFADVITFDMGGTSTDVALCPGHLPQTADGQIAGLPLHLPIIDIHTVGAGGGSLAYLDAGNALHVGPQSAGADPAPACYGRADGDWQLLIQGGRIPYRATTTDANLVLGRLDAASFLGGRMQLDGPAAERNLAYLAREMYIESASAAWKVIEVANARMERAIRRISVERGYDPRRFTLVAFGGAGPLHAGELAQRLHIPRVLVPAIPGVLSALGMLAAAPARDYSRTVMRVLGAEDRLLPSLDRQFADLAETAKSAMLSEGYMARNLSYAYALDMRYLGQSHELTIPYIGREVAQTFHRAHEQRYGYQRPEAALEVVNLRLRVVAGHQPPPLEEQATGSNEATTTPEALGEKPVIFAGGARRTAPNLRSDLLPGQTIHGPAILFQYDTTTVIPPAWAAEVDAYGNLVLAYEAAGSPPLG